MHELLMLLLFLVLISLHLGANVPGLNILDFGAIPDGKVDDTLAFQTALDKAADKGIFFTQKMKSTKNSRYINILN